MKNVQELKIFVRDNLTDELRELETKRKDVLKKIIMYDSALTLVYGIILYFIFQNNALPQTIQPLAVTYFLFFSLVIYFTSRGYTSDYKNKVIKQIVSFLEPTLTYNPETCVSRQSFYNSEIFREDATTYKGDDHVSGNIEKTSLEFSELDLSYTTGSGKNRRTVQIFKGLFFIADFNKNFKGRTFVLPDFAEKLFGSLGSFFQSKSHSYGELVKVEDPEFEKEFVVYSNDQVEARYILSPSLIKRILDYKKKANKRVHLSFVDNKLYVAVSFTKNLFEPRILKSVIDFAPIQEYYEDLCLAISIVEELNLNLRIWAK